MKYMRKYVLIRVVFMLFAAAVQLLLFMGTVARLNDYFSFFYSGSLFISLTSVLLIINNRSNPSYKIAWIIPITLFPFFGVLLYIFLSRNKLTGRIKNRMKFIEDKTRAVLTPQQAILDEIGAHSKIAAIQSRYIQDYAFYPPHKYTECEYEPLGEMHFRRLKEELLKAEHYIFLEYFILKEGIMWNSILGILKDKVKQGVDVRIIYDDLGCIGTLPYRYDKTLEEMGINCCIFNPLIPVLSLRFSNRDHRKIVIIDGITGFTGGINLADEYINAVQKYGHWKDTAIMIKGDAVWNLTVMFLSTWDYLKGIDEDFKEFKNSIPLEMKKFQDGYVQPFGDSPLDEEAVGEIVYLNLINRASKYVYITTPYLIIGDEMVTALTAAAKGGIDIRIITPYCGDKWYVHSVTRSYYRTLIESGVKIYEYIPGFIHSKTYVADDEYGVVGTINMDFQSLYMLFECGVWLYKNSSIIDIKKDFIDTLKLCRQVTKEDLHNVRWYSTFIRSVLRIFAPLM
ncbi:MAG: cardiolipin synthase [Clostridiaceae bacterium]